MKLRIILRISLYSLIFSWSFASSAGENIVGKIVENSGIKKCLPAAKALGEFLIEDGDAGAVSIYNNKDPDNQLLNTSIERNYSNGWMFMDMTIAPVTSGECAAVYTKISYFPESCLTVANEKFGEGKYGGALNKAINYLEFDGTYVFFMPAGQGCLVARKETVANVVPKGK